MLDIAYTSAILSTMKRHTLFHPLALVFGFSAGLTLTHVPIWASVLLFAACITCATLEIRSYFKS